jgi:DNA repair exonuclease SbcCD ATPase subunit
MLELARALEVADEALAASIAEVDELQRETERLRRRGAEVTSVLAELPAARETARAAVAELEVSAERLEADAAQAEGAFARAEETGREEAAIAARRGLTRARDLAASGRRRRDRAREELDALEGRADEAEREARELEAAAAELSARLPSVGRGAEHVATSPGPGLAGVLDWAARARAALLVVRGGLDTERERLVREANELAAGVLGELHAATSVAGVRERLERRA